jgi:ferric-dicitrate binding protein FerR (iron transport regulator)
MKTEFNTGHYTDRDWELIAADLSGEPGSDKALADSFREGDDKTSSAWNEIGNIPYSGQVDLDKAWQKVNSGINTEHDTLTTKKRLLILNNRFSRIAAGFIIIAGFASLLLTQTGILDGKTEITTGPEEKNLIVNMPDGSTITLNRNTSLSYRKDFGKNGREVKLTGEAFFDITPDPENPFIIDAGKASVKVLGTSFNVITENSESGVEVFVRTGKVQVTDNYSDRSLSVDPGFIGVINPENTVKRVNTDPNYLAWNTGILTFNGQTLDLVFKDLKRVYNVDIISPDQSVLNETWTFEPIDNEPAETIIKLICGSFNLSYSKDGDIYHLTRK